jgi:hypothetical protein
MAATYTKLQNGSWGVRASGKLTDGATVVVSKKDGSTKTETVEKVLWSGKDQKTGAIVSLCAIERDNGGGSRYSGRRRYRDDDQCTCPACSSGSECLCIYGRG